MVLNKPKKTALDHLLTSLIKRLGISLWGFLQSASNGNRVRSSNSGESFGLHERDFAKGESARNKFIRAWRDSAEPARRLHRINLINSTNFLNLLTLLTFLLLTNFSCTTEPPDEKVNIELKAVDTSSTEVWLEIKAKGVPENVILLRNEEEAGELKLSSRDTVIVDEGLSPKEEYTFY